MSSPNLIFIVGPTASGKTAFALAEAERSDAVILSCDSLCIYRGMDIGTAKPTPAEQRRVPHFGIDLAEPADSYSVARYVEYRDAVLAEQWERGKPVLVVGGSGFYLKSFFAPVTDQLEVPAKTLENVRQLRDDRGLEGLVSALRALNPKEEAFPGLDLKNPRRVERALIRCLASGKTYGEVRASFQELPEPLPDWQKAVWLVTRPLGSLQLRNRKRVERMLSDGLVEEVKALREAGFEANPSASGAIGYREVLDCLDGRLPPDRLAEAIYIHTNQLMRKQRSWFRNQIPVHRELTPPQ